MVNKPNETTVNRWIVILGIILFIIIYVIAVENKGNVNIDDKSTVLLKEISGISNEIDNWLSRGVSDTLFLSTEENILSYSEKSDIDQIDEATALFLSYAKAKKKFYQLEYLNETGHELIRISYDPQISDYKAVPYEQLSDLNDVSYFKKTMELEKGKYYISDIHPIKLSPSGVPDEVTLIYATPVINSTGFRKGVVAVRLRVDLLLDSIHERVIEEPDKEYYIVDQDGYYIYNLKNRTKEFGQYTGTGENLIKDYPIRSPTMLSGADGELLNINTGLAVFRTYHYNPSNLSQYIVIIGVNKFALFYQMLLDGIVMVIGLLSYFLLIYAYRNFIHGDFKRLLRSMILIITLFAIYKTLEISETYFEELKGMFIVEQTALILSILMIIVFANQLLEFSKLYGFADKKTFKK
ncbi:MAG: cache domain-containing protein [Candidatus Methanoperedens sp.]